MAGPARRRKSGITPEGLRRLQEELYRLRYVERPRVVREVADAAALGDRSENAEYVYGKRRLREIDARVRFLRRRFDELQVVAAGPADRGKVRFGAWVALEEPGGGRVRYRLVGPDESDVGRGLVSVESPLGRVLIGREEGDEVTVARPAGPARFTLLEVSYED